MRLLLAALGLALAGPVQAQNANCTAQWSALSGFLIEIGAMDTPLPGLIRETADGGCRTNGLVFPADHIVIKAESLRWSGRDMDRFATEGLPPKSLQLALTGIRIVPDIGDPVFGYLQDIQARGNKLDVFLNMNWDEETQSLELNGLRIDLPSDDFIEVSSTIEGIDLSDRASLQRSFGSFAATSVKVVIRSERIFEDYLLLPLGMALLEGVEDPAARVAELKDIGLDAIDAAPAQIVSAPSKAALKVLVSEMPEPSGILTLEQTADPGIGPGRALTFALGGGSMDSLEDIWRMFDGISIAVTYDKL